MNKIIFATLCLCFLALASAGAMEERIENEEDTWTHYLYSGLHSFYSGFRVGFYKLREATVPENCLTDDTVQEAYFVYAFLDSPNLWDILPLIGKIAGIVDNFAECGLDEMLYDLDEFCVDSEEKPCEIDAVVEHLSQNVFQIVSKVNDLVEVSMTFPAYETEEFSDQNFDIGKDIGSIIRFVYAFERKRD